MEQNTALLVTILVFPYLLQQANAPPVAYLPLLLLVALLFVCERKTLIQRAAVL
jgi:hypothetical protein